MVPFYKQLQIPKYRNDEIRFELSVQHQRCYIDTLEYKAVVDVLTFYTLSQINFPFLVHKMNIAEHSFGPCSELKNIFN